MRYILQQGNEELNNVGGLALVGPILAVSHLKNLANTIRIGKTAGHVTNGDILSAGIGLLVQGKTDFINVERFREDSFFAEALDLEKVASEASYRQRLDTAGGQLDPAIRAANLNLLKRATFKSVRTSAVKYLPLDIDVSPMDNSHSQKEGVGWTYKKHDGYAPIFAYLGDFMLASELRPGSQHSQKDFPEFLKKQFPTLDALNLKKAVLIRLDSAHDAAENIRLLNNSSHRYLIKRNLRKVDRQQWLDTARVLADEVLAPREGKTIYRGILADSHNASGDETIAPFQVFEVTVRTIDSRRQHLLIPEIKIDAWWTNLPEPAAEVIRLYHDHATSEQYHSELKSDMNLERLPSGKFKTNATILQLGMVAFNILRLIGRTAENVDEKATSDETVRWVGRAKTVQRRRLRTVMQDLIATAVKRVRHAGRVVLKFGRSDQLFELFAVTYDRLTAWPSRLHDGPATEF